MSAIERARDSVRSVHGLGLADANAGNLAYCGALEREVRELEAALRRAYALLDSEQGHSAETWRDRERLIG